ncbi:LysR family transcriptional regulator [Marinobacterium rhizophilum]|uniref:LysR family transcriptional regulator n=1 Tax=Marinobacterium rhizophilum TaxID=420402 RepID=A0ABY5HGS6_9GAMM|nr:LysR family transcriptional regulator [Marinobacterium rhizophilum]UTW11174.1 LysR family transcriptional regulator [Marinobacterium rhizophilum]
MMAIRYELRHLRYFIAVAEELSFRGAANRLNLAQPALSRSIKQLEDILDLQLLERSSRQVRLTAQGQTFLEGAYQTLELLEETGRQAQRVFGGEVGHLHIGYTDFAITGRLPTILDAFRKAYPSIQLQLSHGFTYQQIESLAASKLDFGFVTGPVGEHDLDSVTVQRDRLVAVVSSQHPLAPRASVRLEELREEPFVMGLATGWRHFHLHLQSICLRRGFLPRVVQEAYNSEGIFGFIEANLGITVHVESMRNYYRKGTVILELDDVDEEIPTDMVWLRGAVTPVQQQFIDFIRQHFVDNAQE